jgi:PiT family inorganic phosphate transporter
MTPADLALAVGALVGFVNGANDVSKGVATLVGAGLTDYRRALRWGAAATAIGGLSAKFLASAMLETFGRDLLAPGIKPEFRMAIAVLGAATFLVLLATRSGLPVSTTHAVIGAVAGVVTVARGAGAVEWAALGTGIVLPLVVSPLASVVLTYVLLRAFRSRSSETPEAPPHAVPGIDRLHWVSSAATSLARSLNETPKIVALVLAAAALGGGGLRASIAFTVITSAMVAGSLFAGRRVTEVLAERVTHLGHREGCGANVVTATLVGVGAVLGWPMSTTHVSASAIMGAGLNEGRSDVQWITVRHVALAWLVTAPAAACLGVVAYAMLGLLA